MRNDMARTPGTNRAVESGFAFLDRLYTVAPNMRFFRREAKPGLWLESLDRSARESTLRKAFSDARTVEVREKEAKLALKMGEKQALVEARSTQASLKRERLAGELLSIGL